MNYLIYVSDRKENCTSEEIDKILASANRNNGKMDITGCLLFNKDKFLQYLEGENKLLMSLLETIRKDDRHKNVMVVSTGELKERVFPSWQMAGKPVEFSDTKFLSDVSASEKALLAGILKGEKSDGPAAITILKSFIGQ